MVGSLHGAYLLLNNSAGHIYSSLENGGSLRPTGATAALLQAAAAAAPMLSLDTTQANMQVPVHVWIALPKSSPNQLSNIVVSMPVGFVVQPAFGDQSPRPPQREAMLVPLPQSKGRVRIEPSLSILDSSPIFFGSDVWLFNGTFTTLLKHCS